MRFIKLVYALASLVSLHTVAIYMDKFNPCIHEATRRMRDGKEKQHCPYNQNQLKMEKKCSTS
jgi:hypothetical protein